MVLASQTSFIGRSAASTLKRTNLAKVARRGAWRGNSSTVSSIQTSPTRITTTTKIGSKRWASSLSALTGSQQQQDKMFHDPLTVAASALLAFGLVATSDFSSSSSHTASCDDAGLFNLAPGIPHHHWTPAEVAKEDYTTVTQEHDIDKLPVFTSDEVAQNDGQDGKPIWMSYGGVVYDVTHFIANHPGGSEKILQAAGSVRNS